MSNQQRPLLSTQLGPYHSYDDNVIIDMMPKSWYPESMNRIKAIYLFYFIAFAGNLAGLIWPAARYKDHPIFIDVYEIKWGWYFVYFSFWVQALQCLFFVYAAFDMFARKSPKSDTFHGIKERLYDSVFATSFLNTIVFWAFVFPQRVKNIGEQTVTFEVWLLDFVNNLTPIFMILIETVIVHHRFAESLCRILYEVFGPIFIYGGYVGFSYAAHQKNKHWPYPYQAELTDQSVIFFYVIGVVILIIGYILAKSLTKCLWSDKITKNHETIIAPDHAYNSSFATMSTYSSFAGDNHNTRNIHMGTNQQDSMVVGSPYNQKMSYNGYGTIDQTKSYY